MTTIALPWPVPPLTKNSVRRMHHHAEAKIRRRTVDEARWIIRAAGLERRAGANVVLHWRMPDRRRRDGDGAAPTLAACIDALVLEEVLPDDSWVHVPHSGITCHAPEPNKPGAMWLTLTDPEGDRP